MSPTYNVPPCLLRKLGPALKSRRYGTPSTCYMNEFPLDGVFADDNVHIFCEHLSPGDESACHPKPKYLRHVKGNPFDAGATIWRTTARTVSNSQQAKLAILSFLMGVELLNRRVGEREPTTEHLQSLTDLTDKALHQLQPSTEQLRPEFEKKRSPARRSIQKGSESAARLPRTR